MAEDKTKKAGGATGTGPLVDPPASAGKKAGSGDKATGGDTGGLGAPPSATSGVDWSADVTTSELDSQKIQITGGQEDSLGLAGLFGNKKPETIGAYRASVASMSDAQRQKLAGVLAEAGVISSKSTPYTPSEVESGLTDALTQVSQQGAKGKTPTLTNYLANEITQKGSSTNAADTGGVDELVNSMQTTADDYQIPIASSSLTSQAQQLLNQGMSITEAANTYKQLAQQQAAGLYPNFAEQIDAGLTTKSLLSPYASLAEKTLGVDPDTINWQSPLYASALAGPVDKSTNRASVASLSDFSQTLMTNPAFGYQNTQEAQNAAGSLTASLLKLFGKLPDESFSTSLSGPTPDLAST